MGRIVRWLPFLLLAFVCFATAYHPELNRKPFSLSLDLSPSTLAYVVYKPVHYRASAALFLLALLAVGARRLPLALGLTLLVCFGIELIEATVPGHYGRLADMPSYLIGAGSAAILWVAGAAFFGRKRSTALKQ